MELKSASHARTAASAHTVARSAAYAMLVSTPTVTKLHVLTALSVNGPVLLLQIQLQDVKPLQMARIIMELEARTYRIATNVPVENFRIKREPLHYFHALIAQYNIMLLKMAWIPAKNAPLCSKKMAAKRMLLPTNGRVFKKLREERGLETAAEQKHNRKQKRSNIKPTLTC